MSTVKARVCVLVIVAIVVAGCSSSSGDVTISSLNERVATLNSRVAAADAARASAERERDEAQKAQAAGEVERDAAKAERDALQLQLDARTKADDQSSAALCTPEVLLPVVAGLFPENDRWNIVNVQVSQCAAGYVRLFAIADQSVCTSDAPQCLENEQVFLHDVAGAWTYLDSGTGLSCTDPQFMSLPIVPACEALSVT